MYTNIHVKQKDETKQISSTGARALFLLFTLFSTPKTFARIQEEVQSSGLTEQYSIDMFRMDLCCLKSIGCKIEKADKENDYLYFMVSHPFKVNISPTDSTFLREAYQKVSKTCSAKTLLNYHYLFTKLAFVAKSKTVRDDLLKASLLKDYDIEIIRSLVSAEKHHNKIRIEYDLNGKSDVTYDITLEWLGFRSKKLYAFCYNHTLSRRTFLRVANFKKILFKFFDRKSEFGLDTYVKFKLTRSHLYPLEKNESIVDTTPDALIIDGRYYNDFVAMQRILSFGDDCTVLEPPEFREFIIEKLLEIKELYGNY